MTMRAPGKPSALGERADASAQTLSGYHPKAGLAHELRALNLMFSSQDIVKLTGPNTAAFIEKSADLGTLETGKLADNPTRR